MNANTRPNTGGPIDKDLANRVSTLESLSLGPLAEKIHDGAHPDEAGSGTSDLVVPTTRRHSLKTKLTASAASVAMIVGITGMAWAAQGAEPGDWNYGLNQAMEALGIDFGPAPDRLAELAGSDESHPVEGESHDGNPSDATGLLRAAEAVESSNPSHIKDEVADLLTYLYESGRINGRDIAAWAKAMAAEKKASAGDNKPENPGTPDNPGKP